MIHEELNQARIEQKTAAKSLNAKERAKLFDSLKGSKYTLLKAEDKLSDRQKEKLEKLKEASPLVRMMHSLKEEFHVVFKNSKVLLFLTNQLILMSLLPNPYYS